MFEVNRGDYRGLFRALVRRMVLASVVPILVVGAANSYLFYRLNRATMVDQQTRLVRHQRELIDAFLRSRTAELQTLAHQYALDELLAGNLERVFRVIQEKNEVFTDVGIIASNGDHLKYIGPFDLSRRNYRDAVWFAQVVEKGVHISDVFLGFRGVPHFVIAVKRQEGGGFWILRATIDTDYFSRLVDSARSGRTGEGFIVNSDGLLQTHTSLAGALLVPSGFPDLNPHPDIRVRELDLGGKRYLCTSSWLEQPRWLLIYRQELTEVYSPLRYASLLGIAILLLGALGAAGLAVVVARSQTRYIRMTDGEKATLAGRLVVTGTSAAIGEMSAGLAHEINNPLATIDALQTWIADLAREAPVSEADRAEILETATKIGTQVERCKAITLGMLKFARRVESNAEALDLNLLLSELCTMARARARVEGVELSADLGSVEPVVSSASHLQQIFLNLVNNALDAVAGRPAGHVVVTSRSQGAVVEVTVTDNGCGIRPEHLIRIFDPFFTTKSPGHGTGLGLAICHGLVSELRGTIHCDSHVGLGTTFTVRFPRAPAAGPAVAAGPATGATS
ncbi:MAG: hypothetical protein HY906_09360 [Deltaproteobacteria bacterium]|nr:hypothetical protein [Deltaproteobacteria bacterium]